MSGLAARQAGRQVVHDREGASRASGLVACNAAFRRLPSLSSVLIAHHRLTVPASCHACMHVAIAMSVCLSVCLSRRPARPSKARGCGWPPIWLMHTIGLKLPTSYHQLSSELRATSHRVWGTCCGALGDERGSWPKARRAAPATAPLGRLRPRSSIKPASGLAPSLVGQRLLNSMPARARHVASTQCRSVSVAQATAQRISSSDDSPSRVSASTCSGRGASGTSQQ